eukprot:augustus_masked-scaffold_5-processed-gene-3.29-mRNA-1 protein AED:1.00 eAED:1.00 QI:0/-1/0/0/-1/1/1/0/682
MLRYLTGDKESVKTPKKPRRSEKHGHMASGFQFKTPVKIADDYSKQSSRKRSGVHKYFTETPGVPFTKTCVTCGALIKSKGGTTTGMRSHVMSFHTEHDLGQGKNSKKIKLAPSLVKPAKSEMLTYAKSPKKVAIMSSSKPVTENFLNLLIEDGMLLQDIEKPGMCRFFQNMKINLDEGLKKRLHKMVDERHKKAIGSIKKTLQNDKEVNSLSVFVDSWSADVFEGYLSIGVQYLNSEFQLRNFTLSYSKVLDSSDSKILADKIYSVLNDFGIVKKVKFITGDNSEKISEAIATIRSRILVEHEESGTAVASADNFHIFCLGKLLNSYSKQVLDSFEPTLKKLKDFSLYWGSNNALVKHWISAVIWKTQENGSFLSSLKKKPMEKDPKKIPTPFVSSDWNSILEFLTWFSTERKLFLKTQAEVAENANVPEKYLLHKEDLIAAEIIKNLLEDFQLFVEISCKGNNVTLSSRKVGFEKLLATIDCATKTVSETAFQHMQKNYVKNIVALLRKMKNRVQKDADVILSTQPVRLSSLLDKRFPHKTDPAEREWEMKYQILVSYFEEINYKPPVVESKSSALDLLQVAQQMQSTPEDRTREIAKEVSEFLQQSSINPQEDVLEWWNRNSKAFPRLAFAARQILACPSTSCKGEAIFSNALQLEMDGQIGRDKTYTKRIELQSWTNL